ncbi:MAG: hypothetical protein AVDCRST_MAG64-514 [uncultured Phycisphaerae bacterium]|uniref:Uncharacterized protein n=1 Tax=uncultured Phycisphaerae bacterium TaxID=904963 RepID=A0A6J4N6U8_9BACT|nr:MAG: hypothetical protein AVDCRST_MAG64-514 [uncultured Phycisphaerae bacterium]
MFGRGVRLVRRRCVAAAHEYDRSENAGQNASARDHRHRCSRQACDSPLGPTH